MALSNIEERIERSLFEVIRKNVLTEGYIPDINDNTKYPFVGGVLTKAGQGKYDDDLKAIEDDKDFAVEVFNVSGTAAKGLKRVPRIVIIAQRIMPGDIGLPPGGSTTVNPLDPNNFIKMENPLEPANFHLDIHLISSSAKQSRFLNAIIQKSIGQKKYIPFYDLQNERFFIRHFNYYDLPDPKDGTDENVYSFEIPDLFIFDDSTKVIIKKITRIDSDIVIGYTDMEVNDVGEVIKGESANAGTITIT